MLSIGFGRFLEVRNSLQDIKIPLCENNNKAELAKKQKTQ
jgi:hypothetical protein